MRWVNYAVKQMLSRDVIITEQEFFKKVIMRSTACLKIVVKNSSKLLLFGPGGFVEVFYLTQTMQFGLISIVFVVRVLSTGFLKIEKRIILYL